MVRSLPLSNSGVTLVDDADYPAVCGFPWRHNSRGYVLYTTSVDGQRREVYLHRLLLHAHPGQVVDHLDHDLSNNVRANLRLCSQQENLRYRRRFANNGCGFKGVTAWRGRWLARIYVNDRALRLGVYDDLLTAAQAYDYAAKRLFGDFALLNLPDQPAPPDLHLAVHLKLRRCRRPDVQTLLERSMAASTGWLAPAPTFPAILP